MIPHTHIHTHTHTHTPPASHLPLRHGGVGLRCLSDHDGLACKAGYLAAAALTEQAMVGAADQFKPFSGPSGAGMQELWGQVGPALQALKSSRDPAGVANPTEEGSTCGASAEDGPAGLEPKGAPPTKPEHDRRGSARGSGPVPTPAGEQSPSVGGGSCGGSASS